ncbi:F-box protein At1g70590-like isoform X1 [Solanum dulcamara]|uniref:F-box protein At1g70590-like isoform X1 n=1 Tax=Solanum dulcamara TaxID=45834 RepID=UPI00248640B1|nr:F-box protein At1g70590-like isoform X1 [Solanum dulcamara]
MNQKTWPPSNSNSDGTARFTAFSFIRKQTHLENRPSENPFFNHSKKITPTLHPTSKSSSSNNQYCYYNQDFSQLPYDVILRIAATFTLSNLRAVSLVCKSWCDALRPLRESMVFLRWGKRFKHGRGGVKPNLSKALDSFLKGAARGSTLAMVDAGLLYWEMGKREEGIGLYRKAAELGDPAGQCNLGISLLQVNPPDPEEAVKWLYKASAAGHVRAQYQLALSLHKVHGPNRNLQETAKWYMRAAEGGYVRAMYNTALCYSVGEGLMQSHKLAKKWMKRAADRGHSKAQFEHGLSLYSDGEMMQAVVYLELAARAGEAAADPVKNVILQQMSTSSRDHAMLLANIWRALPSSH